MDISLTTFEDVEARASLLWKIEAEQLLAQYIAGKREVAYHILWLSNEKSQTTPQRCLSYSA